MLTAKQQRFIGEYLIDLNATQAAIRAGYSAKTAGQIGDENLKKPEIAEAVAARQAVISQKLEVTQERVVAELAKIGFSDVRRLFDDGGRLHHVTMLPDDAAACIQSIEVDAKRSRKLSSDEETTEYEAEATLKIRLWDKRAALVDLGKHLGMFKERVELTGKDGNAIEIEQKVKEDADVVASAIASLAERAGAARMAGETQH
jgi:phage terminase small subunit